MSEGTSAACWAPSCMRRITARSLCHTHYERVRRSRILDFPIHHGGLATPPELRFFRKVEIHLTGKKCWIWSGRRMKRGGYGRFDVTPHIQALAHRWCYEFFNGPIPQGMELDHTCRTTSCVYPDHMEVVSRTENTRRENVARNRMASIGIN